jgi:hypothetical protein
MDALAKASCTGAIYSKYRTLNAILTVEKFPFCAVQSSHYYAFPSTIPRLPALP